MFPGEKGRSAMTGEPVARRKRKTAEEALGETLREFAVRVDGSHRRWLTPVLTRTAPCNVGVGQTCLPFALLLSTCESLVSELPFDSERRENEAEAF